MSRLELRHVCSREAALKQYANAVGRDFQRIVAIPHKQFIHIVGTLNKRTVNVYCNIDKLLQQCSADTASLAVEEIDKKLLAGLAKRYFSSNELLMPVSLQPFDEFHVLDVIDGTQVSPPLISMGCEDKFIWVELKDIDIPVLKSKGNNKDWSQLSLQTYVSLGSTTISFMDAKNLTPGDLLMLVDYSCKIIIANTLAISCRIEEDNMIVDSMEEYNGDYVSDSVNILEASDVTMDNIALKVDFVLEEQSMTLAQLQTLQINELLPLQGDGTRINVNLRVGKLVIASGELVRVDDNIAVEIQKINGAMKG